MSATHVTSSRAQINKSSTYFNVFSPLFPFQPFCGSHAFSHKHFCSVALVSDKRSAQSSVIKYSCICFSDRQAESTHTFSFQKILSNLVKNIFCLVPSTNMGYLCSLKTLNFCTFSDIHPSHGLIQNFSSHT